MTSALVTVDWVMRREDYLLDVEVDCDEAGAVVACREAATGDGVGLAEFLAQADEQERWFLARVAARHHRLLRARAGVEEH